MKIFTLFSLVIAMVALNATSSSALVTVEATTDAVGTLNIGDTFDVAVNVDYDGTPPELTGIFTSTQWDPSELSLQNFTAAPFAILFGANGFLANIVQPQSFPGDPAGSLRAVQFGANPGQFGGPGSELITTLTFEVVGAGDGMADVDVVFLTGDGIFNTAGSLSPADRLLVGTTVTVPEPNSAALALSALGTLGLVARRRSRQKLA